MQFPKKGIALSLGLKVRVFGPRKWLIRRTACNLTRFICQIDIEQAYVQRCYLNWHAVNTEPFPPHHRGSNFSHQRLLFSLIIGNFDIQSYCYCSCYFQFLYARAYFRVLIRIK